MSNIQIEAQTFLNYQFFGQWYEMISAWLRLFYGKNFALQLPCD